MSARIAAETNKIMRIKMPTKNQNPRLIITILIIIGMFAALLPNFALDGYTNTALVPQSQLEKDFYDWGQRHQQIIELTKKQRYELVFLGDSITHMFGGQPEATIARGKTIWDYYFGKRQAINMGFGWDRIQNVIWRINHGAFDHIDPKVVVLLIGTNNLTETENARKNSPIEIYYGIRAICEKIHQQKPTTQIILVSILPRAPEHYIEDIRQTNRLIATLDQLEYISYLDLYNAFATPAGLPDSHLMHDRAHPNAVGYRLWAVSMEPILNRFLERP